MSRETVIAVHKSHDELQTLPAPPLADFMKSNEPLYEQEYVIRNITLENCELTLSDEAL